MLKITLIILLHFTVVQITKLYLYLNIDDSNTNAQLILLQTWTSITTLSRPVVHFAIVFVLDLTHILYQIQWGDEWISTIII